MAIKEIKREWSPEQLGYVKTYLLHSETDVKELPKCCIGSKAIVSETGRVYVCSASGEWGQKDETGVVEGCAGAAHKVYVTDAAGNPTWEDRTHGGTKYDITWNGKYDNSKDTPGSTGNSFLNVIVRLWKISDQIPPKEALFSEDAVCTTNGRENSYKDMLFEGRNWYGRWGHAEPASTSAGAYMKAPKDGKWPVVYVVTDADNDITPFITDPGVYCFAGNVGKKIGFERLQCGWFKALDEAYIPESIPRMKDVLPTPTASDLNATVRVLSNGKIAWMPADADSDALYYNDVVNSDIENKTVSMIKLPDSMSEIQKQLFEECADLTHVVAHEGITAIANDAFQKCINLCSILNLDGVQTIGERAFQHDAKLKTIDLPSVTSIKAAAFDRSGLETLDLTMAVNIESSAFSDSGLSTLVLRNSEMSTLQKPSSTTSLPLYNTPIYKGKGYIYVPTALLETYKADAAWGDYGKDYADRFRALEEYTIDGTTTGKLDESKINA